MDKGDNGGGLMVYIVFRSVHAGVDHERNGQYCTMSAVSLKRLLQKTVAGPDRNALHQVETEKDAICDRGWKANTEIPRFRKERK